MEDPSRASASSSRDLVSSRRPRVDVRWSGLLQSLSGLFCASLSSMNNQKTTSPSHTFLHGPLPVLNMTYLLRHATLSSENVCTENLIPFVKLLPCAGHAGLGELLEPHQLFGADWHGLRVHIGWDPEEGVVVRLGVNAVFDPVRTSSEGRRGELSTAPLGC
jgi:phosphatidylinositol glycan class T